MGGMACCDAGGRTICLVNWIDQPANTRCLLHHDHISLCADDLLLGGVI